MADPAEGTSRRGIFRATVTTNAPLCDEHFRLELALAGDFPPTRAGQFVQLMCAEPEADLAPKAIDWPEGKPPQIDQPELVHDAALLRRPFSLAGRRAGDDGTVRLEIIQRVVGVGTGWLAKLRPGDAVDVLGPLGNTFTYPDNMTRAVLVGGGVGIPPMLYLAAELAKRKIPTTAFVGATSARLLPLTISRGVDVSSAGWPGSAVAEFMHVGAEAAITTDDGALGLAGRVTDALWPWIDREAEATTVVYTCGPEPMMRAVAAGCVERNLACQVAMERQMACGMGTCQSCVCKTRAATAPGWQYKLVCTDGPVFDGADLVWDDPHAGTAKREEHGKDRG